MFTKCNFCECKILKKNLKKHLSKVHSEELTESHNNQQVSSALVNNKNKTYTRKYYKCRQCNKKITKNSLIKHLNRVHQFFPKDISRVEYFYFDEVSVECKKENVSATQKSFEETYLAVNQATLSGKKTRMKTNAAVKCKLCSVSVNASSIVSHFKNHHQVDMTEVKFRLDNPEVTINTKPVLQLEAIDSVDIFDRLTKLNGGGYGLGKNRKH